MLCAQLRGRGELFKASLKPRIGYAEFRRCEWGKDNTTLSSFKKTEAILRERLNLEGQKILKMYYLFKITTNILEYFKSARCILHQ